MGAFIDTRGRTKVAIAICGRCKRKVAYDDLRPDGNSPGLMVCQDDGCWDPIDPWRLPPRQTEDITLEHARPDLSLDAFGPVPVYVNPLPSLQDLVDDLGNPIVTDTGQHIEVAGPPVAQLQAPAVWAPNAAYGLGAQVAGSAPFIRNPVGPVLPAPQPATLAQPSPSSQEFWLFVCIKPGVSGAVAPAWPTQPGVEVADNTVIWINAGLRLP
jgi:hypothetical protein